MPSVHLAILISYAAFISLGLPDAVLGIAWPSIRSQFTLSVGSLGWVLVASGAGYFISSSNVARLMNAMKLGTLLTLSTLLVMLGVLGFALAPSWPLFIAAAPLVGLGSGAIDAGLNTYAAHQFSVRNINWLHACYGIGATLGPVIMVTSITRYGAWTGGYFTIGAILFGLAILFFVSRQVWRAEGPIEGNNSNPDVTGLRALKHPTVRLQALLFFCYTGFEVSVGQWSFTLQTELRSFSRELAGTGTILYWTGLTAGRIGLGAIADRIGPDRLLRLATFSAVIGLLLFLFGPPLLSLLGLGLIGASLAPIYPTLMSRTPSRVGSSFSKQAIGFQVTAAMFGALAIPSAAGFLGNHFGLNAIAGVIAVIAIILVTLHEILLRK